MDLARLQRGFRGKNSSSLSAANSPRPVDCSVVFSRGLGAEVRPVPAVPYKDEMNYNHQAKRCAEGMENGKIVAVPSASPVGVVWCTY